MAFDSEPLTGMPDCTSGTTPPALQGRRILIVDDNFDAAESFAALLRLMDNHVSTARDGPEALRVAREQGLKSCWWISACQGCPGTTWRALCGATSANASR